MCTSMQVVAPHPAYGQMIGDESVADGFSGRTQRAVQRT